MSTAANLGLLPSLLPVTGTFLGPFALLHGLLSLNVVRVRLTSGTRFGDKSSPPTSSAESTSPAQALAADPMYVAIRAYDNLVENAPMALLLAGAIELNGGDKGRLRRVLSTLLALRIAHALGLSLSGVATPLRVVGYYGTQTVLFGLGWWSWAVVKGYSS